MAINILFTSAGRRVELLSLFREAYQALQLAGTIVALDIDPLAPALRIADRHYIVPKFTDPNYVPSIVEICRREQIHMVFPLIDPDIPVLTSHRAAIEATGARLATVSAVGAGLTGDKWESVQFFQRLGLAAPQSWLPSTLDPDAAEYPLFIKPRCGSAAKDTFKVKNARELRFFMDYVSQPIIQEFLAGPEITSDVICDLQGETLAVVSRRRIEVRWGEVAKGVTVYDADITSACVRIARELQAVGPITVQCILKEGRPFFNEVNARLGGGAPLGVHAGSHWPRWLLARAAGMACEPAPLGTYKTGVFLTRFDDSYFLTEADCDKSCHL